MADVAVPGAAINKAARGLRRAINAPVDEARRGFITPKIPDEAPAQVTSLRSGNNADVPTFTRRQVLKGTAQAGAAAAAGTTGVKLLEKGAKGLDNLAKPKLSKAEKVEANKIKGQLDKQQFKRFLAEDSLEEINKTFNKMFPSQKFAPRARVTVNDRRIEESDNAIKGLQYKLRSNYGDKVKLKTLPKKENKKQLNSKVEEFKKLGKKVEDTKKEAEVEREKFEIFGVGDDILEEYDEFVIKEVKKVEDAFTKFKADNLPNK